MIFILLKKYVVPPYTVEIIKDELNKQLYLPNLFFNVPKYYSLTKAIEKQILNERGFLDNEIIKLQSLIEHLKSSIEEKLKKFSLKDVKIINHLRDWMVYKILGLEQLMPLLIDDQVQEIYLDKPNLPLYLDHQDFGRCLTKIILSEKELESFKSRLCLERDTNINILNPSLKTELKTEKFHIRAAIDIPPLAYDWMSMNIRKLRRKIWTLPELIANNMLTIEAASYLLFILYRRYNITIIGEPGSGKTTLANAIDFLTPTGWRKITIEDVIESIEQTKYNKFQTRYSVSTFEEKKSSSTKSQEIIKLLHRSPTWVFLGEIQTAEHSKALFEALSAGLVGIQTCHGRSIEMMLLRWINQHGVPLSSILTLDILIENNCNFNNWSIKRNLFRIVEISKNSLYNNQIINSLSDLQLIDIFRYDLNKEKLVKKIDLFESPTLKMIRQKEKLSKESFESELDNISSTLNHLVKNQIYEPDKVIKILNEKNMVALI